MTISKAAGGVIILSHLSLCLFCFLSLCFASLHSHLHQPVVRQSSDLNSL